MDAIDTKHDETNVSSLPLVVLHVTKWREYLIRQMDKANHFTLDLSAQIDCDTAGIQLLLSTRKTAEQTNKSFTIAYPNAAVRKAAERLGIALGNEFQLIEEANR